MRNKTELLAELMTILDGNNQFFNEIQICQTEAIRLQLEVWIDIRDILHARLR